MELLRFESVLLYSLLQQLARRAVLSIVHSIRRVLILHHYNFITVGRSRPPSPNGLRPPADFEDHAVSSDRFGKFSTLPDSLRTFQGEVWKRSDPSRPVLNIELSRFYHSTPHDLRMTSPLAS